MPSIRFKREMTLHRDVHGDVHGVGMNNNGRLGRPSLLEDEKSGCLEVAR